ncbi:MAG: hypothetical protein ACI31R_05065 [Bacilli bacterium]
MNNAILFFYNINSQEIKKINNNYYFTYLNNNYGIYSYNRDITEAESIYYLNLDMLNKGLIGYEIILTQNREVLFMHEETYYILMKFPNIRNRIITYEDVISFYFPIEKNKFLNLDKSNWGYNWSGKIDFIEYQFSQVKNKFPILENSIDYFIGIWENAISYFNDNVTFIKEKQVCHKRVDTKMDLLEFLNPLNFVIDYKERDIGEYLKSFIITNNYSNKQLNKFLQGMSKDNIILLISRILFPSYYFDLYEDIVLEEKEEEKIIEMIEKRNNVNSLLKYIFENFSNYNIPYIEWIKK